MRALLTHFMLFFLAHFVIAIKTKLGLTVKLLYNVLLYHSRPIYKVHSISGSMH